MYKIFAILMLSLITSTSFAGRFWTGELAGWTLYLNNGVAYVMSGSMPSECSYDRAQLNFSDDPYNKALWSYLLAASKTGDKLLVVLDHDQGAAVDSVTCVIHSAKAL